ncbi:Predicted methyltransferase [Plasmopara halstedii]|uniref:Predicted methyltransferase n=1 Tax=Plasmopara halstedii TaxID=4781 RepID=A0A0P1A9G9_PLAHL|nr:Predicted methyltransferase [Plasmopara halstedii]CEG37216.1 Predicted methyltransferase [Plasmopara halstedii]|eukprot:XP_024573585.1 Predicted methyltransferase [Plasmopara halstedii]
MASVWRRTGVLISSVALYAGVTFTTYITLYDPKKHNAIGTAPEITDARRLQIFDTNASKYDKKVNWDERLTGISLMRRFLLRKADGQVLEVAAGTGRNLPFYRAATQVTLTDFSHGMLDQLAKTQQQRLASCELKIMSADNLCFEDDRFDTVVDTFGLCSMDNPVRALQEMQRVCKKDSGRILLLEHGRSNYVWLSGILDKFADLHAQKWGCHWNRDILALLDQAGLEVETLYRFHFGTTYYIVAKPMSFDRRRVEKS